MKILAHVSVIILGALSAISAHAYTEVRQEGMLESDSLPAGWRYIPERVADASVDTIWWQSFNDPVLNRIIAEGLRNNYDVRMASRRVEIARQTLKQARSLYFPTLTASGGWQRSRSSGAIATDNGSAVTESYWDLGVDLSWEVDLFGRVTAQARQRGAQVSLSRADQAAMLVSISAKIASAYIDLRTQQAQLAAAREHLASQEQILNIARARYEAGLNNDLDLSQAQIVYLSTRASIPALEAQIHATLQSLRVLMGNPSEEVMTLLENAAPMPDYRHLLPIGVPADLLRRRPDIIAAEAAIAADASAVGIAKKDFLPTLTLEGSIGTAARSADRLFHDNSLTYSVAPRLSWTIFDGLGRNAALAEARLTLEADVDSYNLTVMTAVTEVETALAQYQAAMESTRLYQEVMDGAKTELDLSFGLFKGGLNPFSDVATAQIDYLNYSTQLIQSQGTALQSLVTLYQALGGGIYQPF